MRFARSLDWLCAAGAILAPAGMAHATPYNVTSLDASRAWEMEVGIELEEARSQRLVRGPVLNISAPIAPGLESSVAVGRGFLQGAGFSSAGPLDLEWAVKWELIPARLSESRVTVTVEPVVVAPTGAGNLSGREWRFEIPVVVGRKFGAFGVSGLVGYGRSISRRAQAAVPFGLLTTFDLDETMQIGAEWIGEVPLGEPSSHQHGLNAGLIWALGQGLEIHARIGRHLRVPAGEERATSGALELKKSF